MGVAVTTVAILELTRTRAIDWSQETPFGPVTLFRVVGEHEDADDTMEEGDERPSGE